MIIDTNNGLNPGTTGNLRSKGSGTATAPDPQVAKENGAPQGRDSVNLSPEAQKLSRLENQINATGDINADRVETIKRALADGSFEINAERIAGKMLDQDDLFA